MTDPLAVVTPPPSIKPGRTVWLNTRPRWDSEAEESKTFFSPWGVATQFMVMHRRAKFGYKRYIFSPWHPSSWWCTAVPSLVTKGTDSPHDIPVHGDAPPCQVWLQKVQILPMTSQFMVMHRRAKFGYKRYRFSPWHPSSWWCTAVPSLVTKGWAREVQKITAWIKPLHMDRWTHTSSTPPPPPPLKKPSHMDRWTHTSSTPRPPQRWQSPHTWTDEHTHLILPPPPPRLQRPHTRTDEHTHPLSPPPPHPRLQSPHTWTDEHSHPIPPPPPKKKEKKKSCGYIQIVGFRYGLVSNWIVIFCRSYRPARVTSGQSNCVISKCTFQNSSHVFKSFLKSNPQKSIQTEIQSKVYICTITKHRLLSSHPFLHLLHL